MATTEQLKQLVSDKKIFETRLALKTDTLENWKTNGSKVLLPGEVGVVTTAFESAEGSVKQPVTMLIIGDGKHTVSQLINGWTEGTDTKYGSFSLYARASDVIKEAKSATDLETFVLGLKDKLVTAIGGETYVSKSAYDQYTKGNDEKVSGAQNTANDAISQIEAILKDSTAKTLKELEDSIANNSQTDQSYAKGLVDALTAENGAIYNANAAIEEVKKTVGDDSKGLTKRVKDIETWKSGVSNVMDFRGAFAATKDENGTITVTGLTPKSGDVVTVTTGGSAELVGKEFVYDGSKWVEIGDVTAQDSAISALQTTVGEHQKVIENLDKNYDKKGAAESVKNDLQGKIDTINNTTIPEATQAAKNYTDNQISALSNDGGAIHSLQETVDEHSKLFGDGLGIHQLNENQAEDYVIFNCGSSSVNI